MVSCGACDTVLAAVRVWYRCMSQRVGNHYIVRERRTKAWFPLPELTARVDG